MLMNYTAVEFVLFARYVNTKMMNAYSHSIAETSSDYRKVACREEKLGDSNISQEEL